MGNGEIIDSMIHDGLWDPYDNMHMGNCGDAVAAKYSFTREDQDDFAIESYKRAQAAQKEGRFKEEIIPVTVKDRKGETLVDEDEEPKRVQLDKLASLRPAFSKDGTVTAANASTLNDGAAALLVTSAEIAKARGYNVLARIVADSTRRGGAEVVHDRAGPRAREALREDQDASRSTGISTRSTRPSRASRWRR